MIDPSRIAELDAVLSRCVQTVPGAVRSFYSQLIEKGFTSYEALQLTQVFLHAVLTVPAPVEFPQQTPQG